MISIVYLVLVFSYGSNGATSERIPQANIKQCEINKKSVMSQDIGTRAYCIVGVKE